MPGETRLNVLLSSLKGKVADDIFVFVSTREASLPIDLIPQMMFRESEGITYILRKEEAEAAGIPFDFPSRMITLDVHSSLDAVGFMAAIADALAKEEISVNPIAAFHHDHIFVPDGRENDAFRIIEKIAAEAGTPSDPSSGFRSVDC